MTTPKEIEIITPAKINFFLNIQNKRPDGYHNVILDLVPVALYDIIRFIPKDDGGIQLESTLKGVPQEENLVVRAIRLLEAETGKQFSLKIVLDKYIPSGAGLGGGSGNAAGTLVAMNEMYQLEYSNDQLRELAVHLGTDVPFFIEPMPVMAEGLGDEMTTLPVFPTLYLLLLYPGYPIMTRTAYEHCTISGRPYEPLDYSLDGLSGYAPGNNDFWHALVNEYPDLNDCRNDLLGSGAIAAGLSGSGSTLFGVYTDQDTRNLAFSKLNNVTRRKALIAKTLSNHAYL